MFSFCYKKRKIFFLCYHFVTIEKKKNTPHFAFPLEQTKPAAAIPIRYGADGPEQRKKSGRSALSFKLFVRPADAGQHIFSNLTGNAAHCYNVGNAADQKTDSQNPDHGRSCGKGVK